MGGALEEEWLADGAEGGCQEQGGPREARPALSAGQRQMGQLQLCGYLAAAHGEKYVCLCMGLGQLVELFYFIGECFHNFHSSVAMRKIIIRQSFNNYVNHGLSSALAQTFLGKVTFEHTGACTDTCR